MESGELEFELRKKNQLPPQLNNLTSIALRSVCQVGSCRSSVWCIVELGKNDAD